MPAAAHLARNPSPITVSQDLYLSPLQDGDKPALVRHLAEPAIATSMLRIPHPYTIADAHQWVTLTRFRARAFGRDLVWAIRDSQGFLIGCAGFEVDGPGSHRAELGYWLAKPFWGRGWMTAVVQALVTCAWQHFGWNRLSASVFAENLASARVLEKAGFQLEGTLRKHYYKAGIYSDAKLYGIVRCP